MPVCYQLFVTFMLRYHLQTLFPVNFANLGNLIAGKPNDF